MENGRDLITINTKDGKEKIAELVAKFEALGVGEYVIYKLDGELYGAKYEFDGSKTNLITDLSDNEKQMLNEMLHRLELE